jgi:hypothetical protein
MAGTGQCGGCLRGPRPQRLRRWIGKHFAHHQTGTTATASRTSTTQREAAVSTQVIADYRTMWADLVTAAESSDFQSPLLSQHATGAALTLQV